ncbi:MAG: glucose-1-phosphate adenylyltransferase [Nitrospirae bacterium]|nr:glucose-1-phosphate adenylyltransferase [Nitrospirota bacterium]
MAHVVTMILAGGAGTRLEPLTKERAKPAVPFGGRYRIIDFVLSNFVNSGFFKIKVLTQVKASSLIEHIGRAWRLSAVVDQYIDPVPAQMRRGTHWYLGTADAVYQNLNIIHDENPDYVFVFGGDHIYKMDVGQMLRYHIQKKADVTISTVPVPVSGASDFGIIEIEKDWRIKGFEEKPKDPKPIPGRAKKALASMGNYIFNTRVLKEALEQDAENKDSSHDFGRDILPSIINNRNVFAYNFMTNIIPGMSKSERGYWRDVGTIDSYWTANMDLTSVTPAFNLYNYKWPLRTHYPPYPPAKFVFADEEGHRMGIATDSIVCEGSVISGGHIDKSILSPRVRINSYSFITESILMEDVEVGRYAKIRRAIIDKGVNIPPEARIGYDIEEDKKRFYVSPGGIVVISKGTIVE